MVRSIPPELEQIPYVVLRPQLALESNPFFDCNDACAAKHRPGIISRTAPVLDLEAVIVRLRPPARQAITIVLPEKFSDTTGSQLRV